MIEVEFESTKKIDTDVDVELDPELAMAEGYITKRWPVKSRLKLIEVVDVHES